MSKSSPPPERNGDAPRSKDEISLIEIATVLLRYRRILVLLPVGLALLVGVVTLLQDRTYRATAAFMPHAPERGGSATASLARQFGINIAGAERPGQSPHFYADLVTGREVLRQAVETEYVIGRGNGARVVTLIDVYEIDESRGGVPPWRKAVERLRDDVSAAVSRETGVVQLAVSSRHPELAEQIAERLLELLNQFNLETRQSQAIEEGRFVAARMTEAQAELLEAEEALKDFMQRNRQFENSPELRFEYDRLQRQVGMRQQVYTTLLQSHEQARIDAVRDTPLITVIASPGGSAEPQGRGTLMRTVLAFLLGTMLAVFFAFILEFARRTRDDDQDEYREFTRLKHEAWKDLSRPGRWLPGRMGRSVAGSRSTS